MHVHFLHFAPAFAMVAGGASRYEVCPNMLTPHVPRDDVIHRQTAVTPAAVLAGIIVTAEYFAAR